ncbi:uncharacterized protein TRIADDRAFT_53489 [Trichoplax adhaerens]|uniref:Uncharacterized protein n=1 Tax=Trichoplax adhaerens TaxID=10228 RepID=B3RPC9_TRIAD|nr:hypothetical protein TRIADDRAFT_53489 [Trichoplax adhaerens]EDV28167.1 hypothetical protein TRIADDRAFT_53489 [Trichoplax adhaerens]|eukprot:XP_002110001.1 hypothetical protein TRIADDRAFT_53489 [Trichoplax adhaerens]
MASNTSLLAATAALQYAKKQLTESLGDSESEYWSNLKQWFKGMIKKSEFDMKARELLGARCDSKVSLPRQRSSSQNEVRTECPKEEISDTESFDQDTFVSTNHFQPVSALRDATSLDHTQAAKNKVNEGDLWLCSRTHMLPNLAALHFRISVTSWENGLDSISDDIAECVMVALENHLKNIISASLSRRTSYSLTDGRFQYNMGSSSGNPLLRNNIGKIPRSSYSTVATMEADVAQSLACSKPTDILKPLTLPELLTTLIISPFIIPSQTVYATALERLIATYTEKSQEEIFSHEALMRQEDMQARKKRKLEAKNLYDDFGGS